MESTKTLKEKILAALLRNDLSNVDLNILGDIAANIKRMGISVSVHLPPDPENKSYVPSREAMQITEKFADQYGYGNDMNAFARKCDDLLSVLAIPVPNHLKIQGIKTIREHTGLGLADSKWVVENIFHA